MALDRPLVRAPELPPVAWLNTAAPPSLAELRGQVVLLHFWDFTCLNCLRTLPALRDWQRRYQTVDLAFLGVHTPEFPFAHDPDAVRRAAGRLGLRWPIALDNRQELWTAFANRAWPSIYLIDRAGYLRYRHEGDARYSDVEGALRQLLTESAEAKIELPVASSSDSKDTPPGTRFPDTRELQVDQLGNGPVAAGRAVSLSLPGEMDPDAFYLEGAWRAVTRGLTLESATGQVALRFEAGSLFSVLAGQPGDGGVDADAVWVEAFLDGAPVGPGAFGQDLILLQGASGLRVGLARSYHLLQSVSPGPHELRLAFTAPGATLYSITLEGCSVPPLPRSEVC